MDRQPPRHPGAQPGGRQAGRGCRRARGGRGEPALRRSHRQPRGRGRARARGRPAMTPAKKAARPLRVSEASEATEATEANGSKEKDLLLSCRGVDMSYGQVQILFDVDFDVAKGEMVALLGTNGAGKSTLLKGICGLVRPTAGSVVFNGENITKKPADTTAKRGISLMPGGKGVFPTLSVDENLRLATWLISDEKDRIAEAKAEVLDLFPVLEQRRSQMAG